MSCATARVTFCELAVGASSKRGSSKASAELKHDWGNSKNITEEIRPELMRYRDLPTVVDTCVDALEASHDPMLRFLHDTPDKTERKWDDTLARINYYYVWSASIHEKRAWTINRGESLLICTPAVPEQEPKKPLDKIIDAMYPFVSAVTDSNLTKQQLKRREEFRRKRDKAFETSGIKYRINDMLAIHSLATAPAKQGRGYASTLVRVVNSMADEQDRAIWLGSTNVAANTGFYNSLGFFTVERIWLGEDDPTWTEPPLPFDFMIRESQAPVLKEKGQPV